MRGMAQLYDANQLSKECLTTPTCHLDLVSKSFDCWAHKCTNTYMVSGMCIPELSNSDSHI